MFDSVVEANQKLKHTIVMLGEEPVYIDVACGTDSKVKLEYCILPSLVRQEPRNISDFEIRDLGKRLGYVNIGYDGIQTSTYTRRTPIRKAHSTQGLSTSNVFVDKIRAFDKYGVQSWSPKFDDLYTKGLKETLQLKYPTLDNIRYKVNSTPEIMDMAFDRYLSIRRDCKELYKLFYKGEEIGWTDDLEVFRVEYYWRYLDELFDEKKMKMRS